MFSHDWRECLRTYLSLKDPSKISTVDSLLTKHQGRELPLYLALRKSYEGAAPDRWDCSFPVVPSFLLVESPLTKGISLSPPPPSSHFLDGSSSPILGDSYASLLTIQGTTIHLENVMTVEEVK
eukprot:PhF_6_TR9248/c0_g1_i2/m.14632